MSNNDDAPPTPSDQTASSLRSPHEGPNATPFPAPPLPLICGRKAEKVPSVQEARVARVLQQAGLLGAVRILPTSCLDTMKDLNDLGHVWTGEAESTEPGSEGKREAVIGLVVNVVEAGEEGFLRLLREIKPCVVAAPQVPGMVELMGVTDIVNNPGFIYRRHKNSLGTLLASHPSGLGLHRAASLACDVAAALSDMHRLTGRFHGALAPDTVVMDKSGKALVTAYGLATGLNRIVPPEARLALNPYVAAPEQLQEELASCNGGRGLLHLPGAVPGLPTDVWALGCIIYACLTGRPPFAGADVDVVATELLLRRAPPSVPRAAEGTELARVLSRCLQILPAARPTMAEAAQELAAAAASLSVQSPSGISLGLKLTGSGRWPSMTSRRAASAASAAAARTAAGSEAASADLGKGSQVSSPTGSQVSSPKGGVGGSGAAHNFRGVEVKVDGGAATLAPPPLSLAKSTGNSAAAGPGPSPSPLGLGHGGASGPPRPQAIIVEEPAGGASEAEPDGDRRPVRGGSAAGAAAAAAAIAESAAAAHGANGNGNGSGNGNERAGAAPPAGPVSDSAAQAAAPQTPPPPPPAAPAKLKSVVDSGPFGPKISAPVGKYKAGKPPAGTSSSAPPSAACFAVAPCAPPPQPSEGSAAAASGPGHRGGGGAGSDTVRLVVGGHPAANGAALYDLEGGGAARVVGETRIKGGCCSIGGHTDPVTAVGTAWTSRGLQLAITGGADGTILVWLAAKRTLVGVLEGHTDKILHIATCPRNPSLIVSTSVDRTARVWNTEPGANEAMLASLEGGRHDVPCASFHPSDESLLYTASGQVARLWQWRENKVTQLMEGHTAPVRCVAPHPLAPRLLATASEDGEARVWDVEGNTCRAVLDFTCLTDLPKGSTTAGWVVSLAFCPVARPLLAAAYLDGTVRLFDWEKEEQMLRISTSLADPRIAFAPADPPSGRHKPTAGTVSCILVIGGREPQGAGATAGTAGGEAAAAAAGAGAGAVAAGGRAVVARRLTLEFA